MALVNELPSDWNSYGAAQKIAWFNAMEVTIDDLRNAGVDSASINWMLNNGYQPPQEPVYQEPAYDPVEEFLSQEAERIAAREETARQEAVNLRNRLLAGNPDGEELTRRVVIEAVNNKWTPEQTLNFVNTQFGVNATMADYEKAVSNFFAPAVSNLLANGATEADIRKLGADQGIIPAVIDAAIQNNIGQIEKNDLTNAVKDFYTTEKRTEGGVKKTYILPDFAKLIDYAATNKLSYADVAAAFSSGRPEFGSVNITKDLVYEKDRQQFNTLLKDAPDPKDSTKTIKTVSYGDALNAAITQGISLENLAKFFGQTQDQFKTNISSNLASFADSLRASGVNPEAGLSDLLGIKPADTTAALKTFDTDKAITGSLKQKEAGGLTYNEILDEIEASGMTIDDFVNRYFGQNKTDLITGLKSESKFTPEQRDLRDDYNAFASGFNKDNPLTYAKISDYLAKNQLTDAQASSLLGISANDLAGYRTDTRLTNRLNAEKADDGKLSLSEILDVIDGSGMDINTFVEKYFGKDQSALATSLTAEKKFTPEQRALRETYNDYIAGFGDKKPTLADVASFVDQNKLTDAQAESVLGVPAKDLGTYRRDTFITSGLNALEKSDNRLDYTEIVTFAKDNNIPFSEVAKYLATPEKQASFVKTLEDTQTDMGRSPSERLAFQLNELTNSGKQSGTWDRNEGWDHHAEKMTNYLTNLGITDLRNIATKIENRETQDAYEVGSGDDIRTEYRTVSTPHVVYYDKATGKELQAVDQRNNNGSWEFGSEGSGKGSTGYILAPTSKTGEGGVGVTSQWREKYGVQEYAMPLAFIAAAAAPYLLPELIGGVVGGVELAALGGEAIAGTGLTGSLMSAGIPASVAPYAAQIIVNGVYNGTLSEATGGDFTKGFVSGGLAPVLGTITSNAVNSALADLNLPAGIDKAAGNAVMQLISKGEIDPLQMLTAGVSPSISKALQDATGLNSAQTKLVLDTVLSQGKNLQALMNPQTALNFVMQNKGVFDGLGLDAASGATNIKTGQAVDLGAFNEDQIKQLTTSSTLGDAVNSGTAITGNGDPIFLGDGTVTQPVVTDTSSSTQTIPGGSITIIPGQPKLVTDEVSGETYVTSDDRAYVPVLEYYQGPNGTVYTRDLRTDTVTQYTPQGGATSVLGGELLLGGESENRGVVVSGLPPTAKFMQTVYTDDITAGSTPGASLPTSGDSYLLTQSLDQSVKRPAYLTTTDLPDGSKQVFNRLTGDRATINANGDVIEESLSKYSKLNNAVNTVVGTVQVGGAELGKFYSGAAQQLAIKMGLDDAGTQKLINFFQDVENSGRTMRPEFINQSANQFVQDVYRDMQAAANRSETGQPSGSDQFEILKNAIKNNPAGALTLFGEELVQNPELLLAGPGKLIGSFILNVGESAGAQALDKANELKQADIRAGKPVKTDREYANLASKDAGTAALVTGLVSMVPGLGGPVTKTLKETGSEYLEEFTIAKMTGKSDAEAASNGAIGAFLGGKVAATSELGNVAQQYMAGRLGVQPVPEVIAGAANAPSASITVTGKLPTATIGGEPPEGIVAPDIVGGNVPPSTVLTTPPEVSVAEPSLVPTLKLNDIPLSSGDSSPIVDYNQRKIVLVDVDGTQVPFYLSTGLAGKEGVASGQWYPFFGISQQYDQNGNPIASTWINKGSEQEMAYYYGSPTLAKIGKELDKSIGDIRYQNQFKGLTIPSISGVSLNSPTIQVINTGLTPAGVVNTPQGMASIASDAGNLDKSIKNVLQAVSTSDKQIIVINGAIQRIENGQITTPQQLNNVLQQIVAEGNLDPSQLPTVIQAINGATNIGAVTQGQPGIGAVLPTEQQSGTGIVSQLPGVGTQPDVVVQPGVVTNQQQGVVTQPEVVTNQNQGVVTQPEVVTNQQQGVVTQPGIVTQPEVQPETKPEVVIKPEVTPPVDVKPFIDVEPPKPVVPETIPETTTTPVTPTVPPGEFVFKPVEQNIIDTILTPTPPVTPTTPTTPTAPTKPVTPPTTTPSMPFFPFFPTFTSDGTTYVDYGQPEVPPPELYGIFNLPPPEYTRATGPMADVGIMSGATK